MNVTSIISNDQILVVWYPITRNDLQLHPGTCKVSYLTLTFKILAFNIIIFG